MFKNCFTLMFVGMFGCCWLFLVLVLVVCCCFLFIVVFVAAILLHSYDFVIVLVSLLLLLGFLLFKRFAGHWSILLLVIGIVYTYT